MANGSFLPLSELYVGDLVCEGVVTSLHPLSTTSGKITIDNIVYKLNEKQQVCVYLDNASGYSCNKVFMVVDANTVEGVKQEIVRRDPKMARVTLTCYNRFFGASNRQVCAPIFTDTADQAHIRLTPL
jgi:hypothetical protein